jgi:hypothetical protein
MSKMRVIWNIRYNLVWGSLHLINREAVNEKRKLFQTKSKISNIHYNLILTTNPH